MQYVNITVTISQAQGGLLTHCRGCGLSLCWLLHLLEPGQQQRLQRTLGFTSCCSQTEKKKIFMRKIIFDEGMKIPKKK